MTMQFLASVRRNQRQWMVVVTILAIFSFLFDFTVRSLDELSPLALSMFIGALFAGGLSIVGYSRGQTIRYMVAGFALGVTAALIGSYFGGPGAYARTKFGALTPDAIVKLQTRRLKANQFLAVAAQKAKAPLMENFGDTSETSMVYFSALRDEARRQGIAVSNDAVSNYINARTNESLTKADFVESLAAVGLSESELFDIIREELEAGLVNSMLTPPAINSAAIEQQNRFMQMLRRPPLPNRLAIQTPEQLWQSYRKINVRQALSVVPVPVSEFVKQVPEPAESELRTYFEERKNRFSDERGNIGFLEPPKARLAYLVAKDLEYFEQKLTGATDQEVADYYEKHKEEYVIREIPEFPETGDPDAPADATAPANVLPAVAPPADPVPESQDEKSTDSKPAPEKPADPASKPEDKPAEDAPADKKPEEKKTDDPKPEEAKSEEAKPNEAKPEDSAPDSKPGDSQCGDDEAAKAAQDSAPADDAKPADAATQDETTPDAAKPESPPAKPSDEPAKPADPPADEPAKPAAEPAKPATETPAAPAIELPPPVTPPAGGPLPPLMTEPPKRYRALDDDLKLQIREKILLDKAFEEMSKAADQALAFMDALNLKYLNASEAERSKLGTEFASECKAYAEKHGLSYVETRAMTRRELSMDLDERIGMAFDTRGQSVADSVFETTDAEGKNFRMSLFSPQRADAPDARYSYWKIEEIPQRVPDLKEETTRELVVKEWKFEKARELADKRARELAELARKSPDKMAEALSGETINPADKLSPAVTIRETPQFSWLRVSQSFETIFGQMPVESTIDGIDEAGPDFLKLVFEELGNGEIGVGLNRPRTTFYVVRVHDRNDGSGENGELARQQLQRGFMQTEFSGQMPSPYDFLAIRTQQFLDSIWHANMTRRFGIEFTARETDTAAP